MKTLTKTFAAVSMAAVALASTTTVASASDYRKCKDTEAAIAGGLIGGSLGTVLGEEIAGRGDKTEGAILGAVLGGVVGAAIGDGASDCEKDGRRVYNTRNRGYTTSAPVYQRSHTGYQTTSHHRRNNGYRNNRGYTTNYGYNDYDRSDRRRDRQLRQIDRQIDSLRNERRQLKDRARYEGPRRWIDRRLHDIAFDLDRLKSERKRVKRAGNTYRQPQRGRQHYHGNNICYSNH